MFPERIKELRVSKRLTQQEISDKLGITRPAYTAYETGKRQPDFDTLQRLANIFEVTTDFLLGRTVENDSSHSLIAAHIEDDVSEEDMKDILNYIEYRKNNPLGKKK